ncbi:MAG: arabinogalactan endo-1,4-beta-galactosidase, partial [Cellvibrio sp.]
MTGNFNRALLCTSILALGACGGSGGGGLPEAKSSSSLAASSLSSSAQSSSVAPIFSSNFALGADISWASEMETNG